MSRIGWLVQQAAREQLIPVEGECCIRRHSLFCEGSDCPEKRAVTPNREKSAPHHPHLAEIDEVLDPVSLVKQVESNIGRFALKGNER